MNTRTVETRGKKVPKNLKPHQNSRRWKGDVTHVPQDPQLLRATEQHFYTPDRNELLSSHCDNVLTHVLVVSPSLAADLRGQPAAILHSQ